MQRWAVWVLGALFLIRAAPSTAQPSDESLPRFAADLHAVSAGLPAAAGWTPPIPAETTVPSRSLGMQGAGTVYFGRLGVGAALLVSQGKTTPVTATPEVRTRVSLFAPQVSLNFGRRFGWSYLSAGYGAAKVESDAAALGTLPAASVNSGWAPAFSFGGGARWFIRDHFGAGFDLRWHRLSSREIEGVTAPSTTLFVLGAGITIQ